MRTLLPFLLAASTLVAEDATTFLHGCHLKGGKATYSIENGELVGTAVANTPNTFLCTDKEYGDFVLEYEFKVDERLNSGVQIRSRAFDKPTTFVDAKGKTQTIPAGRVHGYQIEIDTDSKKNRMWTAGLYEEGRRSWLVPGILDGSEKAFTEQGRALTKVGDWNHVRIEAIGPRLRTWLNGQLRVDVMDGDSQAGFIGFQVHSIPKELAGTQNRWRNVILNEIAPNTLAETEKASGWKLLFDGSSTDAWRSVKSDSFPAKGWVARNGTLTVLPGNGGESVNGGDIVTKITFKAFEFSTEFRITEGANSGIKYFVQPALNKGAGSAFGLEFQILDDVNHADAKLGKDGNRTIGSLYDLITAKQGKLVHPIGQWNYAFIRTDGTKVEHWLNGRLVVSYDRSSEAFRTARAGSKYADAKYGANFGEWESGNILLQDHGNEVSFRSIKVRDLSK